MLYFIFLLFSLPSFAGTGVTTAQPIIGYQVMAGQNVMPLFRGANGIPNTTGAFGSLNAALNGTPSSFTPPPTATASNPAGYTPLLNSSGAATLQAQIPVSPLPPSGQPVSASLASSAAALGGVGLLATAPLIVDVPLGSGVGSAAFNMAIAGGGLALAVGTANPLAIALAAVGVGQTGYSLYNALKANGLTVDAVSGQINDSGSPAGYKCLTPDDIAAHAVMAPNGNCYSPSGVYIDWGVNSPATAPAPASPVLVQSAVAAAVSSPAVALDAAALAIKNGVDIQSAIDSSSAISTVQSLRLASEFSMLSNSIDSLGNTTANLQRTILDVSAGPVSSFAPNFSKQDVSVSNSMPQNVQNTSLAPLISAAQAVNPLVTAATSQPSGSDLCVAHPDALACSNDANLSDVPLQPLNVKNINTSITPVVFGSASCPAPISIGGGKIFDFSFICGWLLMLRPLILAFAWLAAAGIVFRGRPYA